MRVIAGTARGKNLQALPGEDITRPTINRVKEAMFSSVQFLVPGARVLDLFAGSGQLGIEALSRGAKSCLFVDRSAEDPNVEARLQAYQDYNKDKDRLEKELKNLKAELVKL